MADLTTNGVKIISLQNLGEYDALLKQYVSDADAVVDAKSIKTVLVDGDNIKFYKKANATTADTADYTVAISSSDVEKLKTDVTALQNVTKGYDTEGSIKASVDAAQADATQAIADAATADGKAVKAQGDVDALKAKVGDIPEGATATTVIGYADEAVKKLADGQVKTNKDAIDAINNTTTGILATSKGYTDDEIKKVTDSIGTVPTDSTVMDEIADAKKAGTDAQSTIDTYKTANDSRVADVENRATTLETAVGNVEELATTSQVVVEAINELKGAIEDAETAGEVTVDTSTTTEGYLKSYTIKQGGTTIATVDIPKDMVVQSGEVVVDPEGQPAGTYIKLVIANQEAPIFINVKDLVDIYTAKAGASQVQLTVDGFEISAALVAGGVGTTELADDAVVTAKIADKNVTLAKLSDSVQTSLGLADTALQSADITTGSANGTIAVEGTDVAVKGLEDAAFTTVSALNTTAKGYADDAEANAKAYADGLYEISSTADINKLFEVSSAE